MKLNLIWGVEFWAGLCKFGLKVNPCACRGFLNTLPRSDVKHKKHLVFSKKQNTSEFFKLLSMASSSSSASMKRICFYCKTVSNHPQAWLAPPEWLLCSALYPLRPHDFKNTLQKYYTISSFPCLFVLSSFGPCSSAYEEGRFCNIFHLDASGWRDCVTCKKIVHCGCIMSTHTHTELDSGGVRCTECISNDILMGANSRRFQFKNARPRTLRDLPEVRLCVDLGKVTTGITYGTSSQEDACESREQLYADSPDGVNISDSSTVNKKPQSNGLRKIHSYRRYLPEASDEDMQQIRKHSNSVVIPLFEKELTISDADSRNGRLDYLPKISEPQGFPIKIQDTGGKYWNFHYRFWPNSHSTMYVLEGTRDYMAENQCQPGDKGTSLNSIYILSDRSEGQLVMGLKKAQASKSDQEEVLTERVFPCLFSLEKSRELWAVHAENKREFKMMFQNKDYCPFKTVVNLCFPWMLVKLVVGVRLKLVFLS
ncbi:hypothetical protein Patl1_04542 [Pistacia atlantica]|uniref:Uncharacterized protein n=1 Tax=Pistacia atlantica TaxID=434234 RepID=A0ACC1BQ47_9ROSI|nr:hypothetical protein Patl1_04542 [Pistacia atlantica]